MNIHIMFPLAALLCMSACMDTASGCRDTATASFYVKLSLTERETSKDSRWTSHRIDIADRSVSWYRKSGGFRAGDEKRGKYFLDDKNAAALRTFIVKHGLNRDVHEEKPTAGIGGSVTLDMEILMDGITTRGRITGMLNDWSKRDVNPSNIGNLDYVNGTISFLRSIETHSAFR